MPIHDRVAAELDRHQSWAYQGDDDLVFGHPHTGGPLDSSNVLARFKAARRGRGQAVEVHDLRYTFGTQMAAAGVPMRTLQEWMGHRDVKMTMIYADYQESEHDRELVERAFHGPKLSETDVTSDDLESPGKRKSHSA